MSSPTPPASSLVTDSWRFVTPKDLVPKIPRGLAYKHVKHCVWIHKTGLIQNEVSGFTLQHAAVVVTDSTQPGTVTATAALMPGTCSSCKLAA
jgi:hypothetical protein